MQIIKFIFYKVTCMRLAADTPQHVKVWQAHLAYLNSCRLSGGGISRVNLHAPGGGTFKARITCREADTDLAEAMSWQDSDFSCRIMASLRQKDDCPFTATEEAGRQN